MHLLAWANNQPVWLQVVIGLFVFFVVIPALLFVVFSVLGLFSRSIDFLDNFANANGRSLALLATSTVCAAGTWLLAVYAGNAMAVQLGGLFSLSFSAFEVLARCLTLAFFVGQLFGIFFLVYWLHSPFRRHINSIFASYKRR